MIVLLDMDGVLVLPETRINEELLKRCPGIKLVDYFAHNEFFIEKLYPPEVTPILEEIWAMPGFFYSLEPIAGAKEAMEEIAKKHEVFICSSPNSTNPTCVQEKYDSIGKHFGKAWQKRLIFTQDKTLIKGDILIDDKPLIKGVVKPNWEHVVYGHLMAQETNTYRRLSSWKDWKKVLPELI